MAVGGFRVFAAHQPFPPAGPSAAGELSAQGTVTSRTWIGHPPALGLSFPSRGRAVVVMSFLLPCPWKASSSHPVSLVSPASSTRAWQSRTFPEEGGAYSKYPHQELVGVTVNLQHLTFWLSHLPQGSVPTSPQLWLWSSHPLSINPYCMKNMLETHLYRNGNNLKVCVLLSQ